MSEGEPLLYWVLKHRLLLINSSKTLGAKVPENGMWPTRGMWLRSGPEALEN